jgi:TetR/AcrR family transcriptional regulator, repressor for uid operon
MGVSGGSPARRAADATRDASEDGNRLSVVIAATDLFGRMGFRRGSMDDVARAAGISRQTIYNYFGSKAGLISEVVLYIGRLTNQISDQIDFSLPPIDLVTHASLLRLEAAQKNELAGVLFENESSLEEFSLLDDNPHMMTLQREYWFPVFERIRQVGQLREDLDWDEAATWLTYIHRLILARPSWFGGNMKAASRYISRYVAPALIANPGQTDAAEPSGKGTAQREGMKAGLSPASSVHT